jgi:hypothetical protein
MVGAERLPRDADMDSRLLPGRHPQGTQGEQIWSGRALTTCYHFLQSSTPPPNNTIHALLMASTYTALVE